MKKDRNDNSTDAVDYKTQQAVDKAPGDERGKKEKLTPDDLKGKKVDADPEKEQDKPLQRPE
jgi:hypothetical protein